jgi:hypothetical protein
MCQVHSNVLALVVVDVDCDFLDQVERLAIGGFEVLEVSPENVVGLAGRQALLELTMVVRIDFPSRFVRLVFATPDLYGDSIDRSVVGSPHGPYDHGVGFPSGFLSCQQAIPRTESWLENESGDNSEQ